LVVVWQVYCSGEKPLVIAGDRFLWLDAFMSPTKEPTVSALNGKHC